MTTYKHKDLKAVIQASTTRYYRGDRQRINALPVTLFQAQLARMYACVGAREWVAGKTAREAWNTCDSVSDMTHLVWLIKNNLPFGATRGALADYLVAELYVCVEARVVRERLTFDELRMFSGGQVPPRVAAWRAGREPLYRS